MKTGLAALPQTLLHLASRPEVTDVGGTNTVTGEHEPDFPPRIDPRLLEGRVYIFLASRSSRRRTCVINSKEHRNTGAARTGINHPPCQSPGLGTMTGGVHHCLGIGSITGS